MTGHPQTVVAVQGALDFSPRGATVTYEAGSLAEQYRRAWAEFAAGHEAVVEWVVREIRSAIFNGEKRVSVSTLLRLACAEKHVHINNSWHTYAADWLIAKHPQFEPLIIRKKTRPAEQRPARPKVER